MTQKKFDSIAAKHRDWVIHAKGSKADLTNEDLNGLRITAVDLSGAKLRGTRLYGTGVRSAKFCRADLSYANFVQSTLVEVDFHGCDLSHATMRGSVLRRVDLRGAEGLHPRMFRNALLEQVKGLRYAQLSFDQHGELGRVMTCIMHRSEPWFMCGCFFGHKEMLERYIENGEASRRAARRLAMQACLDAVTYSQP